MTSQSNDGNKKFNSGIKGNNGMPGHCHNNLIQAHRYNNVILGQCHNNVILDHL
jgi:hypothetical protein